MTGRCWAGLGRPLRAVPLLEDVLEGFDDAHARDKALYSCWLADAYVTAGEPEEAAGSPVACWTFPKASPPCDRANVSARSYNG